MSELTGEMKPMWGHEPNQEGYESEKDRLIREIDSLESYLEFLKLKYKEIIYSE